MDADVDANGVANGTDMRRGEGGGEGEGGDGQNERDTGHGTRCTVGLNRAQCVEMCVINLDF